MDIRRKGFIIAATALFICSTVFFTGAKPSLALSEMMLDEKTLGEICIGHMAPAARINGQEDKEEKVQTAEKERTAENAEADDKKEASDEEITVSGEPLVIIYILTAANHICRIKKVITIEKRRRAPFEMWGLFLRPSLRKRE